MRISDWSSDVCSSDLGFGRRVWHPHVQPAEGVPAVHPSGLPAVPDRAEPRARSPLQSWPLVELLMLQLQKSRIRHPACPVKVAQQSIFSRNIRSEEHTSELQSLMRISYAVFCLKKKNKK